MKEELVVAFFKKHLINTGWTVEQSIQTSYIDKTDFGYIPDILPPFSKQVFLIIDLATNFKFPGTITTIIFPP